MKGLFTRLLVISLLSIPLIGQASPPILSLPQGAPTPVSDQEIAVVPQGVRIHVKGRALRDVLQRVQNAGGIQFELSRAVMDIPITADVEAPGWTAAIRKLLASFNKAEVWDEQERLRRVLVVGSGDERDLPPITATYVPAVEAGPPLGPEPPPDWTQLYYPAPEGSLHSGEGLEK